MSLHYYSEKERAQHLQDLVSAIEAFLPELQQSGQYLEALAAYQQSCAEAKQLLFRGFVQEDLSNLSRNVPQLFWLHKEWSPPAEWLSPAGKSCDAHWFTRLEPLEVAIIAAAEKLRIVGEY